MRLSNSLLTSRLLLLAEGATECIVVSTNIIEKLVQRTFEIFKAKLVYESQPSYQFS